MVGGRRVARKLKTTCRYDKFIRHRRHQATYNSNVCETSISALKALVSIAPIILAPESAVHQFVSNKSRSESHFKSVLEGLYLPWRCVRREYCNTTAWTILAVIIPIASSLRGEIYLITMMTRCYKKYTVIHIGIYTIPAR